MYHTHCSLKCRYLDTLSEGEKPVFITAPCIAVRLLLVEGDTSGPSTSGATRRQYNVDLMIALQMSRLQLLQDLRLLSDDK